MKPRNIEKLHILVGLPGSGKTTFANQYAQKGPISIVSFDELLDVKKDDILLNMVRNIHYPEVFLDGLFPTNKAVQEALGAIINYSYDGKGPMFSVKKIIIHYWAEDRDACLWNDRGRRDINSTFVIKGLSIEKIDEKNIETLFGISTKKEIHYVQRKPNHKVMADENGVRIIDGKYLESVTWSLGGTTRSWGGDIFPVDAETPPDFVEFDDLLEKICPTITFLQYKKLCRECVTIEDRDASDYYSNCREAFYRCDLKKLYQMLFDMDAYQV